MDDRKGMTTEQHYGDCCPTCVHGSGGHYPECTGDADRTLSEQQIRDVLTLVDYVEDDLGRSGWHTLSPGDEDYTAEDAARDASTRLADALEGHRVRE